jgi:hypothetical protein
MKIKIICGECRTQLEAPAALAGKLAVCPKCQAKIAVPIPEPAAAAGNSADQYTNPWDVPLLDVPSSLPPSPFATQRSASRGLNTPAVMVGVLILLTLVVGTVIGAMIGRNRAAQPPQPVQVEIVRSETPDEQKLRYYLEKNGMKRDDDPSHLPPHSNYGW